MSKKMEDKVDKIAEQMIDIRVDIGVVKEKLHAIEETSSINTSSLLEHMKRTDISEKRLDQAETSIIHVENKIAKHLAFLKGAIWVFGLSGAILGILAKLNLL